jgi:AraC family transcriptional regulator
MIPEIKTLSAKKLIGIQLSMSISSNRTVELWRNFMPRRREITNSVAPELYSMQIFKQDFDFRNFDINAEFIKCAAIEVSDHNHIPEGMIAINLEEGLYAVFIHRGPASEGERTFRYIFSEWLPQSGYEIDKRPHFEILGEKYKNDSPDSEEEIWIPISKIG